MSIAIIAPEKFDFQDAVCVEMMLRFEHVNDARFVVEPTGGEDGELRLPSNGCVRRAEIQVKGEAGPVTLGKVAACLAHTPPRTEKNTLLERMLSDPQRLAVLVMSGRCDDSCAAYTVEADWDGTPHSSSQISRAMAAALLNAFSEAKIPGNKNSPLKARRRAHIRSLAANADKDLVRKALTRLIIVERVDADSLQDHCARHLRNRYRIPSDRTGDVLRRLGEDVKKARAERTDALALVRKTLKWASPLNVRPRGYEERGVEFELCDELKKSGVVLLSGKPRVGKSYTARWIAAEFQGYGYQVQDYGEIGEVERFLLEPTLDSRLSILDDPLGGTYAAEDRHRTLAQIDANSQASQLPKTDRCAGRTPLAGFREELALERVDSESKMARSRKGLAGFPGQDLAVCADMHGAPDRLRRLVSARLSDGSHACAIWQRTTND